jgi:hypothetical protein
MHQRSGVPRLPPRLLNRRRLFDGLNVGTAGPVTLVTASAGTGTGVPLASWMAECPHGHLGTRLTGQERERAERERNRLALGEEN